jgi:benzoate 4-monooxygenase
VHHDKQTWGPDADFFRPERFYELTPLQEKAYIPFSIGPRACTGRNVAEMQMALTAALIVRRYDFQLHQDRLEVKEGFLRKPKSCWAGIQLRKA